jgi:hypothetical protein
MMRLSAGRYIESLHFAGLCYVLPAEIASGEKNRMACVLGRGPFFVLGLTYSDDSRKKRARTWAPGEDNPNANNGAPYCFMAVPLTLAMSVSTA